MQPSLRLWIGRVTVAMAVVAATPPDAAAQAREPQRTGALRAGVGAPRTPADQAAPIPLITQAPGNREARPASLLVIDAQALTPRAYLPVDRMLPAMTPMWLTQLFCPASGNLDGCQNPLLRKDFRRNSVEAPDWQELPVDSGVLSRLSLRIRHPQCYVVVWKDDQRRTYQSLPFTLYQGGTRATNVCP
jgi:hypothetical protein